VAEQRGKGKRFSWMVLPNSCQPVEVKGRYLLIRTMNTLAFHPEALPLRAVDYVDFKWLMAGEGHRVDAQRMQTDPTYARQCLATARCSTSELLRGLAMRLAQVDCRTR
jgi:hypothetical protein